MAVRSNKCLLISAIVAVSVMCAVGCNKSHVEKNDTAGAADGATDTVVGNTDSMAGHTDAAGNADPTSAGTDGMKICGSTSLSPEDATKWDCVPDIGFWCTDPDGCPVNGNTAMVGTRLIWVQPKQGGGEVG